MIRTYVNTSVSSTHGSRKAAEAQAALRTRNLPSVSEVVYTVEHTGPRLFVVLCTATITSEPCTVHHIMSGQQIVCDCGSTEWFYTGRSRFNLNYECAACDRKISPVSETGACQ